MDPETYDRWYDTPRGRWIGQREIALLIDGLQPMPGESLLEVGSGTGYFTRALSSLIGGMTVGIDLDPERVAYARGRGGDNVSYVIADSLELPYPDESFDLVVSVAALCFTKDARAAVQEMLRVSRRRIAIGMLNRNSLLWRRKGVGGGSGGYEGAHWHTVDEVKNILTGLPLRVLSIKTAIYLPSGNWIARAVEHLFSGRLLIGAFILAVAEKADE